MLLGRDPLAMFEQMRRDVNQLFHLYDRGLFSRPQTFPALNIWEDGAGLYAEAEVPGLTIDEMEIYVEGNELILKGRRKPCEDQDCAYHRRERGTGEFSRTITLPVQVNADEVAAMLKDGVLLVKLPKAEAAKARKIKVKTE